MRRHITSRILLSFLLLWQLGAGEFVHAHGIATMNAQHAAAIVADQAPAAEEHCAEHASMTANETMEMSEAMSVHLAMDAEEMSAHQDKSAPDCCQSLLCKCPCIQALALSLSLPYVPTALPDAQPAQIVVAPVLHAGITGLFRPPI